MWKQGPLPADTYGWGGVVPVGADSGSGFYFADFCGCHVVAVGASSTRTGPADRILKPEEVLLYDNSLTLPNGCTGRAGGN